MRVEKLTITKFTILFSLVAVSLLFGQYAYENSQGKEHFKNQLEMAITTDTQRNAEIIALTKFQQALKKSGFEFLIKSVVNKSAPINLGLTKEQLSTYRFSTEDNWRIKNRIGNITETMKSLALENKWKKISRVVQDIELEFKKPLKSEELVQLVGGAIERIEMLAEKSDIESHKIKVLQRYLDQYRTNINLLVKQHEKLRSQQLMIELTEKKIDEALARIQMTSPNLLTIGKTNTDEQGMKAALIFALTGLVASLYFFSKVSKYQRQISAEKSLTNHFFDQSQMAWGIFNIKGSYYFGNTYLRKLMNEVVPDLEKNRLSWQVIAEALELKNLYHFDEIKDGIHNLPLVLNLKTSTTTNFNLHINKSQRLGKVMISITPTNAAPILMLKPLEKKMINNYEATSINSLLEDSLEKLSPMIQATNIVINLETKEEIILKVDAQVFTETMTSFLRDTILFANHLNVSRKIDILLYQNLNQPEIRVLLYGKQLTSSMLHLNFGPDGVERTMESSLSELEQSLDVLKPRIEIQNNLNFDKTALFSHINIIFP